MEGFLRADMFLVMSFVGVMFWDKEEGKEEEGVVQGKRRKRKMEGEGLLPVSKWKTLVSKSGQDGRNGTNRAPERGVWTWARGTDKIDSVYVAGFLSGCRMCVLISINIFFFFLKSSPYGLFESIFGEFWKLNEEEQATLANM